MIFDMKICEPSISISYVFTALRKIRYLVVVRVGSVSLSDLRCVSVERRSRLRHTRKLRCGGFEICLERHVVVLGSSVRSWST